MAAESMSNISLPLSPRRRLLGAGFVIGSGLLLGVIELVHFQRMESMLGTILHVVVPFVLAIGLVVAGLWLWQSQYDDMDIVRVAGWEIAGMAALSIAFFWILAHEFIRGGTFHHSPFMLVNTLITGGLVGIVIGVYDARNRRLERQRSTLSEDRAKLAFLNQTLRHHVLNSLNAIMGHASLLGEYVSTEGHDHLHVIQNRTDDTSEFVQNLQSLTRTLMEEADRTPQNVSAVLARRIEVIRETHEDTTIATDVPEGVTVMADELLDQVFENLLVNAIQHNDSDSPEVSVTVEKRRNKVVVRIADNGPGIPDDLKETLFDWETKGETNAGLGIGLAIVATLIDRYDGDIWFEDNDPTGTVAVVELSRATGDVGAGTDTQERSVTARS